MKRNPKGYWDNYNHCYTEAQKYKTRNEFKHSNNSAYNGARRNNWIDDYDWFDDGIKLRSLNQIKWNYEACYEEAKKYKTRKKFQKGSSGAYNAALKNKWLDNYTWFEQIAKPNGFWNYENCYNEAKKYSSRNEFSKNCNSAYDVALRNKWIDDYIWFAPSKTKQKWNYETCYEEAKKYKTRKNFQKGCQSAYKAAFKNKWIDDYTWFEQIAKPNGFWNYENCYNEAKKYSSRGEFKNENQYAYFAAHKNKWIDDYKWLKDIRFDLYKDKIDCVYVYEFKEQNSAYIGRTLVKRAKIRDKEHIYDLDSVSSFAKKHNIAVPQMKILETNLTIKEGAIKEEYWLKRYKENGWVILNKAKTGSIGSIGKGKWNYETCYKEAKKYRTSGEFKKGNQTAYHTSCKNKWIYDYNWFIKKPKNYWNYETCYEESKKYKTKRDFYYKSNRAYIVAKMNNWLDEWFH